MRQALQSPAVSRSAPIFKSCAEEEVTKESEKKDPERHKENHRKYYHESQERSSMLRRK